MKLESGNSSWTSSLIIACLISSLLTPLKGYWPKTHENKIAAIEYRSEVGYAHPCCITSGDKNQTS
mgnify:CR=1 FL=1